MRVEDTGAARAPVRAHAVDSRAQVLAGTFVRVLRRPPRHRSGGPAALVIFAPPGPSWPLRTTDPHDLSWGGEASASIVTDELAHSWQRIRAELRTAVTDDTWEHYLAALDARRLDGSTLVVSAPTRAARG